MAPDLPQPELNRWIYFNVIRLDGRDWTDEHRSTYQRYTGTKEDEALWHIEYRESFLNDFRQGKHFYAVGRYLDCINFYYEIHLLDPLFDALTETMDRVHPYERIRAANQLIRLLKGARTSGAREVRCRELASRLVETAFAQLPQLPIAAEDEREHERMVAWGEDIRAYLAGPSHS